MKKLYTLITLAICIQSSTLPQESIYHILGEKILDASEQIIKKQNASNIFAQAEVQQEDPFKINVETSIYDFSTHEKLHLTTQLLEAIFPSKTISQKALCSLQDLEKLNVFRGSASNKHNNLINTFATATSFGKLRVAELFATTPTLKQDIIKQQNIVKSLANNAALYADLKKALHLIGTHENLHFTFYKHDEAFEKVVSTISLANTAVGKSATLLQGMHILRTTIQLYGILPISIIGNTLGLKLYTSYVLGNINPAIRTDEYQKYITILGLIANTASYAFTVRTSYENFTQLNAIIQNLQIRTKGIADTVRGLRILENALIQNPQLEKDIPELNAIRELFKQDKNNDLRYLIELLETPTFESDPSYFSHVGRVFVAYQLLHKNKAALIPALAAAGLLDAYCAAAQLTLPDENGSTNYNFAHIIESTFPVITIKACTHPLVTTTTPVAHDICINETFKNLHIAGPNGSGKSVVVSEIALAVLEAHTFGIVKTNNRSMPVISATDKILTYLNVQEDLSKNLSTYMAQQLRFEEILFEAQKAHKKGDTLLVIMDEPLTGASPAIAGPRVQEGALQLASYPEVTTILASHYQESATLQTDSNGLFTTCYLELKPSITGTLFTRLFTLTQGQHPWWNKDKELTKNYLAWLEQESLTK